MAQRVQYMFVSDLSGEDLGEAGQTVKFGFLGADYEVDLSQKEADEFSKVVDRYVKAGRRVGGRRQTGKTAGGGSGRSSAELAKIRKWLQDQGHEVSTRGRIKQDLLDQYDAKH